MQELGGVRMAEAMLGAETSLLLSFTHPPRSGTAECLSGTSVSSSRRRLVPSGGACRTFFLEVPDPAVIWG